MTISIRTGGSFQDATMHVKHASAWAPVISGYVRTGGEWRVFLASITAGVDTTLVTSGCERPTAGACFEYSGYATASASGGSGSYSYLWEHVSGTTASIETPTSAATVFRRTGMVAVPANVLEGLFRCRITDNVTGAVAYTPNVTYRSTHLRTN